MRLGLVGLLVARRKRMATKIAPTTPDGQEPFRLAVADLKPSELRALTRLKERTQVTADHPLSEDDSDECDAPDD